MPRRALRPAPAGALLAVLAAATGLTGCGDDDVVLAYRPEVGATAEYRTTVTSSTTILLPDRPAASTTTTADLSARQRVIDVDAELVRVEVEVDRDGAGRRTYVMRFDRAAQLTSVESVEGIPADVLGPLGLTEIFPPAAGAPPARPLEPGERWVIDDLVQLPGTAGPAALRGEGRLVELGVRDGTSTATVAASTMLPFTGSSSTADGVQELAGTQRTALKATYDVDDGSVVAAEAITVGRFRLRLLPPDGTPGGALEGELLVEVRSRTERL